MEKLLYFITTVCGKIQVVSDLFWDFPTNLGWYSSIPILGNFSLAIILLIGSGIYFSIRLRFIQVRKFKHGIEVLKNSKAKTGISPLAAFFLSTLYIGFKYVKKAQEHFEKNDGTPFTSKVIGTDVEIWDKKTGPAFSKP